MYMFEKGGDAVSERRWEVGEGGRAEKMSCREKGVFFGM